VRAMASSRIVALSVALSMAAACGSVAPTAPSAPSSALGLTLLCSAPTVLAGETVVCLLRANSVNVGLTAAVWTSSAPSVATSEGVGLFVAKSGGQTTLTATYSGQSLSAPLTVHLQDVLTASAAALSGTFKVGTTATMWLQGGYGVSSADSGRLTLVVTDQTGATISTSAPQTLSRGGDRYLISTTFTLPPGTTRVCRTGVLQIGAATLTVVPDVSLVPCVAVTP
jgi:hypothetical protein